MKARTPLSLPFKKVLIANRGEIACRIIRAARKLGITSVAVFSTADINTVHTRLADEAIEIGPPPSRQSYLSIPNVMKAIELSHSQAVHPGYGFLSEDASFADLLDTAGITFVGPSSKSIRAMGDKIGSKRLAVKAGVNVIPGYIGEIRNNEEAIQVAKDIGFPVMIKASAGGGDDLLKRLSFDVCFEGSCKTEAGAAFNDSRVLIEKFVPQPRHIEVQVLADCSGNTVYFPERECSVQRRNQKIFEESPSTLLDEETRRKMGEQAVALAKAVDYKSAGTVEFLVSDVDRSFYFLEMNTRLQVEHAITEAVSGIDLAEWMFRIAAGEELTMKQEDMLAHGWAMESRIYAENPFRNFLPSNGALDAYCAPHLGGDESRRGPLHHLGFDAAGVRVDSGVCDGDRVDIYYDSLLAKLVVHASSREEALRTMGDALNEFIIHGVTHNAPFLQALLREPRCQSGKLTTGMIEEVWPLGFGGVKLDEHELRSVQIVAAWLYFRRNRREHTVVVSICDEEEPHDVHFTFDGFNALQSDDGHSTQVSNVTEKLVANGFAALVHANVDGEKMVLQRLGNEPYCWGEYNLQYRGAQLRIRVRPPHVAKLEAITRNVKRQDQVEQHLNAPMPGSVLSIAIQTGEEVVEGQEIIVLEAMKMQNILRAERDAKVEEVCCNVGQVVAMGSPLVRFSTK